MICARCDQPIEPGQTYHHARVRSAADALVVTDPIVHTHDQCPMKVVIVDGRYMINGRDVGPVVDLGDGSIFG